MRKAIEFRTGSKETYKEFCIEHPEINITFGEWYEIIYMYSTLARNYIIETGKIFKFPLGIGEFAINKKKVRSFIKQKGKEKIGLPIDWKKSKEKGKRIYIMNYHTEGYRFSWVWMKRYSKVKFSPLWKFKPHRNASRQLANVLKSGQGYHNKYCEWTKF